MYIMTKEFDDAVEIEEIFITSPRFDIEDVKKIKAFIRFNLASVIYGEKTCDINTILKFGRVRSIVLADGALRALNIRLAGKEVDTLYHVTVQYKDGKCNIQVTNAGEIAKFVI